MSKPLVSIIVPAYNHSKYIENCLDSIINQTYENIELIILNDGSLDNTNGKIIGYEEKLKQRFERYEYINKENEGICKTLNLGLNISKGKYIIPFASDDFMYPERVSKQVTYMEENLHYGMIYADGYDVESEGYLRTDDKYSDSLLFSEKMEFVSGDLFHFMLRNVFLMPTPTVCIRRECYEKVGFYDENILCEDPDMFIRISKYFKIGFIKEPLVLHRLHDKNNGRKNSIIEPSLKSMIIKYEKSDLLDKNEKEELLTLLEKNIGITDLNKIKNEIENKKIIVWGTGGAYEKFKDKHSLDLECFIDSDLKKQGKFLDGKKIFAPSKLLEVNKDEYYVLVLSQFYKEIYNSLDDYGYIYLKNYY